MHRTIELAVPSDVSVAIIEAVAALDGVIGLARQVGASVVPAGDVVTIHALNRDVDEILRETKRICGDRPFTVVTAEVASLTDEKKQQLIDRDVDEAIWEEMETGLRHQGRITPNFLMLMALGGLIAAAGAFAEPTLGVVAYVASAIVTPGFEPLAKLPLGMVLRRWEVFRVGLLATFVGYAVLIAAAALTWPVLDVFGAVPASDFLEGEVLKHTLDPPPDVLAVSVAGAFAGVLILASYRRSVIAGALVAMRLIEAASVVGIGLGMGRFDLAAEASVRLGLDVLFVVAAGILVFGLKQALVHRRRSLR